jgi:putative ABC transport system permease protein
MRFFEALSMAGAAIWAHKLRSFLTLLGVIFGVATVIFVVTLIEGFNKYVDEKVADMGSNAFVVTRFGIITSEKEWREKNQYNRAVKMEELDAILARRQYVKDAAAIARRRANVRAGSESLEEMLVNGASSNLIGIDTTRVGQGRFFSREEDEARAAVCFIGPDVARDLFPRVDPIGREIKVDGRPFRVVGVAEAVGTVFGQPRDAFVTIPINTFLKMYGSNTGLGLRVQATAPETMPDAVDEVRVILRSVRHLSPDEKDNFDILTPDAINKLREQMFGTIGIVAIGITSIALVVGGIVIMNIMLVSVTERTREIGIRKSLGARRGDILKQFLAESTLLSLLGGLLGVGAAWGLAQIFTAVLSVPTTLPIVWTMIALSVSASVGLFFGIYPAWRAARLDPIVALRAD